MRPWFEIIGSASRLRTSGSPEVTGTLCPGLSKLYSIPDLLETTPGSGVYDHWTGRPPFSYWWEFLSAWGIIPGSNPRSLTLRIGGINYPVAIYEYDEDTTLSGSIGNSTNDSHGVVVICHGKLTLSNVTTAVRKRGLFIWGDEVSGTAHMTQKGARCSGQNLYLYPGVTVPATGGAGAPKVLAAYIPGINNSLVQEWSQTGSSPGGLGCGGGNSGVARAAYVIGTGEENATAKAYSGAGGNGTSYCGGSGGGGAEVYNSYGTSTYTKYAGDGAISAGGIGTGWTRMPGGTTTEYTEAREGKRGTCAGGGLLVAMGKKISTLSLTAKGTNNGLHSEHADSGGGCVVALANEIGSVSKSVGNGGYLIQEV